MKITITYFLCSIVLCLSMISLFTVFSFSLTVLPAQLLPSPPLKQNTTLVIIILSHANEDPLIRATLRDTFLRPNESIRWMFLIGEESAAPEHVKEEKNKYNDIVFVDCPDNYLNLSAKVFKGMAKAVELYTFQYLLKIDTDTWVSTPEIVDYLQTYTVNTSMLYIGLLNSFRLKRYDANNHLKVNRTVDYMFGGGYILSYQLAQFIAINHHLLLTWKDEDITVGVHLGMLNIQREHDMKKIFSYRTTAVCWPTMMLTHKVTPEQIYYLEHGKRDNYICGAFKNTTIRDQYNSYPHIKQLLSMPK